MASKRPSKWNHDPDAEAWAGSAIGGEPEDPDKPKGPPGSKGWGAVGRLGEAFWRCCDTVSLSIPRWGSRSRMNANLKWLLQSYDEKLIEISFDFFRNDSASQPLSTALPCWEAYFRRRGAYLRSAERAMEGRRSGQPVRKAGDIHVDNDRFHERKLGIAPTDIEDTGTTDGVS